MTPFASVALYKRSDGIVFRPPRKEAPTERTQARKAAMRYWSGNTTNGTLVKVILLREIGGRLEIAERTPGAKAWNLFERDIASAATETHLAAALTELGVDVAAAPPPIPDVLVINGFTYRRDI